MAMISWFANGQIAVVGLALVAVAGCGGGDTTVDDMEDANVTADSQVSDTGLEDATVADAAVDSSVADMAVGDMSTDSSTGDMAVDDMATDAFGEDLSTATDAVVIDLCEGVACDPPSPCHDSACNPSTGLCESTVVTGRLCTCGVCNSAGACAIRSLGGTGSTAGSAVPVTFQIEGTEAYVGNSYNGTMPATIDVKDLMSGDVSLLAASITGYPAVLRVGATVYFTRGGDVWQVPADGSAAATAFAVTGAAFPFTYMATDGAYLYLTSFQLGNVTSVRLSDADVNTIASEQNGPLAIVTDGVRIYWVNSGTQSIRSMPVGGGSVDTFVNGNGPSAMTIHDGVLYWTEPSAGLVRSLPLTGGTPDTIAMDQAQPTGIRVYGGRMYWTNFSGGVAGTVSSVPLGGGELVTSVGTLNAPLALDGNSQCLYVLSAGNGAISSVPPQGMTE